MKTIHAIYTHGIFQPRERVELPEYCEVEFEPRPVSRTQVLPAPEPTLFPEAEAVVDELISRARTPQERHILLAHFIDEHQRKTQEWMDSFSKE